MYCGVTDINTDGVGLCEYARIVLGQTFSIAAGLPLFSYRHFPDAPHFPPSSCACRCIASFSVYQVVL